MFHIVVFEWDSVLTILFSFCVQVCRCVCEERTFKAGKWNPAVAGKRDWFTSGAYLFTCYSLTCFFIQISKLTSFLSVLNRNYKESWPPLWVRRIHMISFWWTSLSTSCWRTLTHSSTHSARSVPPFSYSKYEDFFVMLTKTNPPYNKLWFVLLHPVGKS